MHFTQRQIEIIEAATQLIGEKGIQNLTTKNLAKQIGFSEPALYRHFKDKTEILKSVLIYYKENLSDGLSHINHSEITSLEKIKQMIEFQFKHFTKNPAVVMVLFSETSFQYNNTLAQVVAEIIIKKRAMVSQIIKNGQNQGDIRKDIKAEQLATVVMGSMRLTLLEWRLSDFSFDLLKKGKTLWETVYLLLKKG